jgi:hypothetical protein
LRQVLLGDDFLNAMGHIRVEVPVLLREPEFNIFVRDFHTSSRTDGPERYETVYAAALMVGRNLEFVGNMMRNGLTDKQIFLEQYASLVVMAWDALEPLLKIRREVAGSDTTWEDFEYLTVLARQWMSANRSRYPKDVARILPPT